MPCIKITPTPRDILHPDQLVNTLKPNHINWTSDCTGVVVAATEAKDKKHENMVSNVGDVFVPLAVVPSDVSKF